MHSTLHMQTSFAVLPRMWLSVLCSMQKPAQGSQLSMPCTRAQQQGFKVCLTCNSDILRSYVTTAPP